MKEYTKAPVSDIKLQVNEENFTDLRAEISGPGPLFVLPLRQVIFRTAFVLTRIVILTRPTYHSVLLL